MSIFELQKERNKQLSQPKIKEPEPVYKPISDTYNIVDYYNTMRNGKIEQITESKAKIPNQNLSYFSEHLKSKELEKFGRHNLNLHSLLSDRATQLKGYNKPQVYEEKISSGADNKVSDELDQLLNSFVIKIQSGVFDITMSNDVYKIFKIFETSSYLFTTELLEKYDEHVKDIISVFKEKSTIELIKRDFKGTNVRQLLLVLTERIEQMIEIMIEANNTGKNNTEKQIILRNFINQKLLAKLDTSYIKIANAEYKKVDAELKTAKIERNQSLVTALTGKLDEIERVREFTGITPFPMTRLGEDTPEEAYYTAVGDREPPAPAVPTDSASSEFVPAVSSVPSSSAKKPKISIEEANIEAERLSELLKYTDTMNADYKQITDRVQEMSDTLDIYKKKLIKLQEDKAMVVTQQTAINADLDDIEKIRAGKRSAVQKTRRTQLIALAEKNDSTLASMSETIKQEQNRINALDADITSLLDSRDQLRTNLDQVKTEIEGMDGFVEDFSQIASNPSIRIPNNIVDRMKPAQIPIRADGGAGEEKEDEEPQLLKQTYKNVVKPKSKVLRAYEDYVIQFEPKFNYPRKKQEFIENVNMKQMKVLLNLLGLNTENTAIPDSPLITVEVLFDHFLAGNSELMTSTQVPQYYFE